MISSSNVLVQIHSATLGGTQINAVDLAVAVAEHGFHSTITAPADSVPEGPSLLDYAEERGVEIRLRERGTTTLQAARTLSRMARQSKAVLVHVYGAWHARAAFCGPARFGARALVHTVYEMTVPQECYRYPDLIVGTGYLVDDLARRPGQVSLISPPVDLRRDCPTVPSADWRDQHGFAPDQLLVVLVSRLDADMKATSVRLAMAAIERLQQAATLVVVGTGDHEAELRAEAAAANRRLSRRAVVFTGPMSDPRPAYAAADVALGMGGSAARALAFGKPLVVVGEGEHSELFEPESAQALFRNSFWSPRDQPDAARVLADSLDKLFASRRRREELGRFGREFAESHFGLAAMADRLAGVYDHALGHYGLGPWLRDAPSEVRALLRLPVPGVDVLSDEPSAYRRDGVRSGRVAHP